MALGFVNSTENVSEWAKDEVRLAVTFDLVDREWLRNDVREDVTRNEFCEFLCQMAMQMVGDRALINSYIMEETAVEKFEDMSDAYDRGMVNFALNLGLVKGVSDTRFEPNRAVTREEAAVMLHRLFKRFDYETKNTDVKKYSDINLISDWAKESVAVSLGWKPFAEIMNDDEIIPQGTISREQVIVMRWRFYEEKYGKQTVLTYEDSEPEILVELGLVSEVDFKRRGNISVKEVFEIAAKVAPKLEPLEYLQWEEIPEIAENEELTEEEKDLWVKLCSGLWSPFFHYSEIEEIDFDKNITYGEAYTYMLRCVENLSDFIRFDMTTDVDEVYSRAFDIGLLDDAKIQDAHNPIPRQEFYKILHKAIFCEYTEPLPFLIDGGWIVSSYIELNTVERPDDYFSIEL